MSATPPVAAPRSSRRRVAGLLAGVAILVFLGIGVAAGWDRVTAYDWRIRIGPLAGAVAALLLFYALNGLGYVLILERLAGRRVDRRRFVSVYATSLLGRYVPGNVLMVASRLVLGREAGIPRRVSLAASVYEHALILGAAALGGVVLLVGYGPDVGAEVWLPALVPLGLALLHPRVFRPVSGRLLARAGREPLESFLSPRQLVTMLLWYLVLAALLGLAVWLVVIGLVRPSGLSAGYVGLSFLLSFVVSMLAFVFPSGLGVREGLFALLLARSLPGEVAIAVSAAVRLVVTAVEVAFAALAAVISRAGRAAPPR